MSKIFKSEELLASLGVTAEIVQDNLIDTVDTLNAGLLTISENKGTAFAGVVTTYALNDIMNNEANLGNVALLTIAGAKLLQGMDKVKKDFAKNTDKAKQMSEENLIKELNLVDEEIDEQNKTTKRSSKKSVDKN